MLCEDVKDGDSETDPTRESTFLEGFPGGNFLIFPSVGRKKGDGKGSIECNVYLGIDPLVKTLQTSGWCEIRSLPVPEVDEPVTTKGSVPRVGSRVPVVPGRPHTKAPDGTRHPTNRRRYRKWVIYGRRGGVDSVGFYRGLYRVTGDSVF